MNLSPVVLFVFNRSAHAEMTLNALRLNRNAAQTDLIVFCDGPRHPEDVPDVEKTREVFSNVQGFRSVTLQEKSENIGLAGSIVAGVSEVLQRSDSVVVLEDDIETSPYFLDYMNAALERYRKEPTVVSVSGYRYPGWPATPSTYFSRATQSWGWGTWSRAWKSYDANGSLLLQKLKEQRLLRQMNFGSVPFYSKMLRDQIAGRNDSWAIRWYASSILQRKLSLYPGASLCRNIGFDASGTHGPKSGVFDVALARGPVPIADGPIEECRDSVVAMRWLLAKVVAKGLGRRFLSVCKLGVDERQSS